MFGRLLQGTMGTKLTAKATPKPNPEAEGREAFLADKSMDDCPYPIGNINRQLWFDGYLAERFKKYE